ncbi:Hsp20/alpha crystallin family protein [Seonamhaeicola sp.]|uniref:Hsp20/alpha crystallin family protein n=1 Tax=Seonamhaeicola sp. TaxID=1912245 RepID=UPI0026049946|nr:Hsp20/alpha crystallin family protein [Seonamhaeicola sp.]
MTSLTKRKRRHRALTPWSNRLFTPWRHDLLSPLSDRLFAPNFNDFNTLMRFDDAFETDFFNETSLMPAMNVIEHENDFEVEFAVPGFKKDDFEVSIEEDILHVSARKELEETKEEDNYSRKEFSYKSFRRSCALPESVDLDQEIKASYKDGILKIKLLKTEPGIEEAPAKKVIDIE